MPRLKVEFSCFIDPDNYPPGATEDEMSEILKDDIIDFFEEAVDVQITKEA